MESLFDAPWDQQPGESRPAFEAFCEYRSAGPQRSLRQVAARVGKSRSLIYRWSKAHAWVRRALEWDLDRAAAERGDDPTVKQARLARVQRSLEAAMATLAYVPTEVARRMEADPDLLQDLPFRDLQRLVFQVARLMPTLVRAEQALFEEGRSRATEARRFEEERAKREFESWSLEQLQAYLREAGFDVPPLSEYEGLDSDDV